MKYLTRLKPFIKQVKDVVEEMNSWLDTEVSPDKTYDYTVKADDAAGNLSAGSDPVAIITGKVSQ